MAEHKVFAGPKIRRVRNGLGLTQSAMAGELGISPSYLNLIERNQRPLTVQLLLKLGSTYDIDLDDLQGEVTDAVAELKEVFSDPLLSGELPGQEELFELAEAAPNAANGMVKLYRAYRESQERMSDLKDLLAQEGRDTDMVATKLPVDEVLQAFETRPYHFPQIESAAGKFAEEIDTGSDARRALSDWLKQEHHISVRTLPVDVMPLWRRRFDKHTLRLFVSERLPVADQTQEIAIEAVLLAMPEAIDDEVQRLRLGSDEARRIARFELARYAASAVLMPLRKFEAGAKRARYDLDVLSGRFGVSFEQVANRLVTLPAHGAAGVSFFLMEVDQAGNVLRRRGIDGYPRATFGGGCPKLPVHHAFTQPAQIFSELVEMPDLSRYVVIARTLEGAKAGYNQRLRRTAILLGCSMEQGVHTVYGKGYTEADVATDIGVSCRLCERQGCLSRAQPPITKPLGLDEMVTGLSAFDFQ
jgi:predicted transcriptional regulator/transcriptional regulator with XRE-family HTH domain